MNWARGQLGKAMPAGPAEPLKSRDVLKTYRYLRIGMIGAVVLLAASIVIEHMKAGCWQTSVSAYYYTPVRSIFVGSMIAVGLALIVYKGRSALEDAFLNVAGMLAPVVAVAPTMDFGRCWSVKPNPLPINHDGSVAVWVVRSIDNNVHALLIAGGIGVVVAFIIAIDPKRNGSIGGRWCRWRPPPWRWSSAGCSSSSGATSTHGPTAWRPCSCSSS